MIAIDALPVDIPRGCTGLQITAEEGARLVVLTPYGTASVRFCVRGVHFWPVSDAKAITYASGISNVAAVFEEPLRSHEADAMESANSRHEASVAAKEAVDWRLAGAATVRRVEALFVGGGVLLLEARPNQCRFPASLDGSYVCGAPKYRGAFCKKHALLAYL